MTCFHPITVMLPAAADINDKRHLIFDQNLLKSSGCVIDSSPVIRDICDHELVHGFKIKIPCGKCIGCRLDYSRRWAVRAVHESMLHKHNSFVTLTFDDEHLPDNRSVSKSYLSSWLKRFRKQFGDGIRFMACGEYGEKFQRPHYHILFFGFDFPDKKFWTSRRGEIYYRSPMLENVWRGASESDGNGYSVIGDVTFESAAYVARYVTKKFDGPLGESKYNGREKEFLNMSRMPGLGYDFIRQNYKHILHNGFVVLPNGHKAPIPRYYLEQVKLFDEYCYNSYKLDKFHDLVNNLFIEDINSSQERLLVREELKEQNLDNLVRAYEFDPNLHNIY